MIKNSPVVHVHPEINEKKISHLIVPTDMSVDKIDTGGAHVDFTTV